MDSFSKGVLTALIFQIIFSVIKKLLQYYKVKKANKEKGYFFEAKIGNKKYNDVDDFFNDLEKGENKEKDERKTM